jgi:AmmeMemoRadiSam system protein A
MNKEILLQIANDAINSKFDATVKIDKEELTKNYPFLQEPAACFVTLKLQGQLRGCIGSLEAHKILIDDLISNAYNAAFMDPRFLELTKVEYAAMDLEISILTPAVKIEYKDMADLKSKIKVGTHGVILKKENKRSTFLPQVWEQLPTFEAFFQRLLHKGSFDENSLETGMDVFVYEVIKVK